MTEALFASEAAIRFGFFVGVFVVMALWESLMPRRDRAVSRGVRWFGNLGIVALSTLVLRALIPATGVGLALIAEERGWGLLNQLSLSGWLAVPLSVLILDLAIYLQHIVFHVVPPLWRLHRMHHADLDFDVTTGVRFHPLEMLLSQGVKLTVIAALGPPVLAVLIFEVVLNATAMFNHGNIRIPATLDRVMRCFVVTPDMHRVHHSVIRRETDSNYGFNVPWWDRLFGTYRAQPAQGHEAMTIGIEQFRTPRDLRLDRMLVQPFRGSAREPAGDRSDA